MRKGLNMKMAAMGLALASMVACTGKTTTDATCCAANGEGNCPEGTCRKECTNACNTNNQKNKTIKTIGLPGARININGCGRPVCPENWLNKRL